MAQSRLPPIPGMPMDADRHQRLEALYLDALDLPEEDRPAFVARACEDDAELHRELVELLATDDDLDAYVSLGSGSDLGSPSNADAIPDRIGAYDVLGEIGRGGMGVVYRVRDARLDREVALKTLSPELAGDPDRWDRFKREARLLAAINHPGIATIHSLDDDGDGTHFLTMEILDGESLAERLVRGAIDLDGSLRVGREIARALEAAHGRGVVHRDLKPANVMITHTELVKVLDFGLARSIDTSIDASQPVLGSPGYVSPERLAVDTTDPRSDVFAFGCVLSECLTGAPVFAGDTPLERIEATRAGEPDLGALPPETPPQIRELLARCLARDPEAREASMTTVRREIERVTESRTVAALLAEVSSAPLPIDAPNNLPRSLTSFVGRSTELDEVARCLDGSPLVTLTGVGGSGKSRLALEVARRCLDAFPDGIWFVSLASVPDPDLVDDEVRAVIGLAENPEVGARGVLKAHLRDRRALLVLDDCEHVLSAVGALASDLLQRSADLRILATSRQPLRVSGEALIGIRPLAAPDELRSDDVETAMASDAVRLFVERARVARPGFELAAADVPLVAEICRRLDGIPLAIELAAARTRALSVGDLAARLDQRFRILTGGSSTGLPRHATLHTLIDWSYQQLDDVERVMLARLSVFVGTWTLEAAELTCAGDPIEEWECLDLVARLIDRSLVEREPTGAGGAGPTRYRLLETVRAFASEALSASGELDEIRTRHAATLARHGSDEAIVRAHGDPAALATLAADLPNLVVACRWAASTDAGELADAACRAAYTVIRQRGPLRLADELAETTLSANPSDAARGRLHLMRGDVAGLTGRGDEALVFLERAREIHRRIGNPSLESYALMLIGDQHRQQGRVKSARDAYETALSLRRELGDPARLANAQMRVAIAQHDMGQYRSALEHFEAAETTARELGDGGGVGIALLNQGMTLISMGRNAEARGRLARALESVRAAGDRVNEVATRVQLGSACAAAGRVDEASGYLTEALSMAREIGIHYLEGRILGPLSDVRGYQGRLEEALELAEEAVTTGRDAGDLAAEVFDRRRLALVLRDLGRDADAYRQAELALAVSQNLGEAGDEPAVRALLGHLDHRRGDHTRARTRLEEAMPGLGTTEDREDEAWARRALGALLLDLGDRVAARAELDVALAIRRERDDVAPLAELLGELGTLDAHDGRHDDARAWFEESLDLLRDDTYPLVRGEVLGRLGRFELEAGDVAAARAALDEASSIATRLGVGDEWALGRRIASLRAALAG